MCINITILDDKEKKSGLDIEIGKHQEHCYAFVSHNFKCVQCGEKLISTKTQPKTQFVL